MKKERVVHSPFCAENAEDIDRRYMFLVFCPERPSPRSELCQRLVKEFGWWELEKEGKRCAIHPAYVEAYRGRALPSKPTERKPGFTIDDVLRPTEQRMAERRERTRVLAEVVDRMVRINPFGKPRSTR